MDVLCDVAAIFAFENKPRRFCIEESCLKRCSFNFPGNTNAMYCFDHKKPTMINVVNPKCLSPGCNTRPNFNYIGHTHGVFCLVHKKQGMMNVTYTKCREKDCIKHPNYNFKTTKVGIYCSAHKKEGMIDIRNRKCKIQCCNRKVFFYGYCNFCFHFLYPNNNKTKSNKSEFAILTRELIDFLEDK